MTVVRRILQGKGTQVWTAEPEMLAGEALQIMAEHNIGALPVVSGGRVAGIFSERDYARKVVLEGKTSLDLPVNQFMSSPVYVVQPETSIEECMAIMTEKHFRHLPVMDGEMLAGIISIGDVVKAVITEKDFTIQHLENYITGKK